MGLPLDVNGDECKVGNWYWIWNKDSILCGAGEFVKTPIDSEAYFQLGNTSYALAEVAEWGPLSPATIPAPPSAASVEVEKPKWFEIAQWVDGDGVPLLAARLFPDVLYQWRCTNGMSFRDDNIPAKAKRLDINQTIAERDTFKSQMLLERDAHDQMAEKANLLLKLNVSLRAERDAAVRERDELRGHADALRMAAHCSSNRECYIPIGGDFKTIREIMTAYDEFKLASAERREGTP